MSRASVPTAALSWAVARASDLKRDDLNRAAVISLLCEDRERFAEKQEVTAALREVGAFVAVGWEDHTPVAVCIYSVPTASPSVRRRALRELHVLALYVAPAQRKRKLGKAIVRLLESVAAENACQQMLVKASAAKGFWLRLGFAQYTGSTAIKSLWTVDEHGQPTLEPRRVVRVATAPQPHAQERRIPRLAQHRRAEDEGVCPLVIHRLYQSDSPAHVAASCQRILPQTLQTPTVLGYTEISKRWKTKGFIHL